MPREFSVEYMRFRPVDEQRIAIKNEKIKLVCDMIDYIKKWNKSNLITDSLTARPVIPQELINQSHPTCIANENLSDIDNKIIQLLQLIRDNRFNNDEEMRDNWNYLIYDSRLNEIKDLETIVADTESMDRLHQERERLERVPPHAPPTPSVLRPTPRCTTGQCSIMGGNLRKRSRSKRSKRSKKYRK